MKNKKQVVFYDGECGFCNKSIQFLLKNEKQSVLFFASLQSEYAQSYFIEHQLPMPDLSTFYFAKGSVLYSKSTAALKLVPYLKWYFFFFNIGYLIPTFLRNKMYDWIAKRRQKLSPGFCAMPTPEERKRFLG